MDIYKEEEFYKEKGWPTEHLAYCEFRFIQGHTEEFGLDYDQFVLVDNALYPYIRLTKKRGAYHSPFGGLTVIAIDGTYARKTDKERDVESPKIAWGLAAVFLRWLTYDLNQNDYVLLKRLDAFFNEYYQKYWKLYQDGHNGLKYSKIPIEQRELTFIEEHIIQEQELWRKSEPLKSYNVLYNYSNSVVKDYESYLLERKQSIEYQIMQRNNCFSTEIREPYDNKPCIKVFFLNDIIAPDAKKVVETLDTVKNVNISHSSSSSHPGNNLTVYPKPMVTAKLCEKEIIDVLNLFFSNGLSTYKKSVKTEVYFKNIEEQVIKDLALAKVSIHVAMAWFTNQRIADKLVDKYIEGVDVKVVSFDDHINAKFGVNIGNIPHREVKGTKGGKMHNKFCVIDNQKVLTGSYNWSEAAENKNDENAAILYDFERASDYSVEFRRLFESNQGGSR